MASLDTVRLARLATALSDSKTALEAKGVSVPAGALLDDIPDLIAQVPSGGAVLPTAQPKDVNFMDYDGTIRYSYTLSEAAALTALPEGPQHEGLAFQGWNWSLEDAQAYAAKYGRLLVGATYITDDGKTRIYIHLEDGRLSPTLSIGLNGSAVIDWGDGHTDTVTGTKASSRYSRTHTYAAQGDYVITLAITGSAEILLEGGANVGSTLLWKGVVATNVNRVYQSAIRKIELGGSIDSVFLNNCYSLATLTIPNGVSSFKCAGASIVAITIPTSVSSVGGYSFSECPALSKISLPSSVVSVGASAFQSCKSLASVMIPAGVAGLITEVFNGCSALHEMIIPDGVTEIGIRSFKNCFSLASITIPDSVTSILNGAFENCIGLGRIHFTSQTPPTLSGSATFSGLLTDCIIEVPAGTLEAYTTATNYPSSETYTYVEY